MTEQSDAPRPKPVNLRILTVFAGFALVALFVYLMVIAESILLPFVIAVFIVLLLDSMSARICRIRLGSWSPPAWLGMAVAILVVILAFVGLGNLIRSNVAAVSAAVPAYEENFRALLDRILNMVGVAEVPSIRDLTEQIDVRAILSNTVSTLASITGNALTVLFYVVFILLEQVTFGKKVDALFRKTEERRRAREMIGAITRDIQMYIGLKTLVSAITGGVSYAIMAMAGVDFAGFWAVLIFVLNFIPYVGSLVGVAFPAVLTLVQFDSLTPFFLVTISLAGTQLMVGNVIEPRLMGRSLNLSPLVILLSLAVFGQIWGIAGMVLSMPLMVIVMIVFSGFETTRPVAVLLSAEGRVDRRDEAV
jgi:predicted PurR-regulated permease PerM